MYLVWVWLLGLVDLDDLPPIWAILLPLLPRMVGMWAHHCIEQPVQGMRLLGRMQGWEWV